MGQTKMEEKTDQVQPEVKVDETGAEQSKGETEEKEPKVEELVKGLQKGYTQTRQEMAGMRETLQQIVDKANTESGAKTGEDEYLTVGKLREILREQSQQAEDRKSQADEYVEKTLGELKEIGIISTKEEEDAIIQYALKFKEPDLRKVAIMWQEIKSAKEEAKKETTKAKAKQEEGSQIGTSSKNAGEESKGVDYLKMQKWAREQGL